MRRLSLRSKLILSFSMVIVVGVFVATAIATYLIGNTIIDQTQTKVRLDLNSARAVYQHESEKLKDVIRLTALRFFIKEALSQRDRERLRLELSDIREREHLDVLTLTDAQGRILLRAGNPSAYGDSAANEVIDWVLDHQREVVATQIVTRAELEKEGPDLADRARIWLIPTPKARPRAEQEETTGMMIIAAAPVFGYDDRLTGLLYGAKLLNRNNEIVDKVKDIVYRGEQYKDKDVGTATIFQGDLRIATNVMRTGETRAIGTRVSQEVYDQVIGQGQPWIGRAFVVNDWYITAYEPIRDIGGDIIGMLYVGMLEAPYVDLKNRVVFTFLGVAIVSILLLAVIAFLVTAGIMRRLRELSTATEKVARGDLAHRLKMRADDEIGHLAASFNLMTEELQKATQNYRSLMKTLEDKVREKTEELRRAQDHLVQSEKLTALGKLAAGIAHEVNNPLTSILLNSHLVAEHLERKDRLQENLKLIIDETARCGIIVRGLLDFSRQTPPQKTRSHIEYVVEKTLLLLNSQILMQNVEVEKNLESNLPDMMLDVNQMQQVFANIVINALDAMPQGGQLAIHVGRTDDGESVEVRISDTGRGIPKEYLGKIFDPFFTTKGMAGTGLGLSVSYGIVRGHGGTIDAASETGKGTTMIIRLPVERP